MSEGQSVRGLVFGLLIAALLWLFMAGLALALFSALRPARRISVDGISYLKVRCMLTPRNERTQHDAAARSPDRPPTGSPPASSQSRVVV